MQDLKQVAAKLPLSPGVYIMKDANDQVIYVGKAKKLKNRVSQYFQDTATHSPKTRHMVSHVDHFDVIVASSEFEALVLECSLIKQYMPKYNILLKDDKGYPYLRLDMHEKYPEITLVSKVANDTAEYFGPFGSRGITNGILETIRLALKLPNCAKKFPRDIGKGRPCLHHHMKQCAGWCQENMSQSEYYQTMEQARQLLLGNYKKVAEDVRQKMLSASDNLQFELAASLRDRLQAIETLGRKQFVTAGATADTDVIGYAQTESKACFSVLHFSNGNLVDKDYEILPVQEDVSSAVSSLVKQYYITREFAPKLVLLPTDIEDRELFEEFLLQRFNKKTHIKVPQRGDNVRMVDMAVRNAQEEAERVTGHEERMSAVMEKFRRMLGIKKIERIESFDISNVSGTDIVAGMVVFVDGKPKRSEYKRFKLENMLQQDDYGAMSQVILRRFTHYLQQDKGFSEKPDLVLVDGGVAHAQTAVRALESLGLELNVFGMVKDDRHRTRALVTPQGDEIGLDTNQAIFSFVGNIQEETHRFAIKFHRELRSKRLKYSQLDKIPGIGAKRKELLLKKFRSVTAIRQAELYELERYLPKDAANAVFAYFHKTVEWEGSK